MRKLPNNEAIGIDEIPNEVYKTDAYYILSFLMVDINSLLYHSHVSRDISDVLLVPIIKDRVKSPWENSHYRLIVIATDFSKKT